MKALKRLYLILNICLQLLIVGLLVVFVMIDSFSIFVYGEGVMMQDLLTLIYSLCVIFAQAILLFVFGLLQKKKIVCIEFKRISFKTVQRVLLCVLLLEIVMPLIIW